MNWCKNPRVFIGVSIDAFTSEDRLLRHYTRAMTIDEYDVTISVSGVRMTSHNNCSDVTMKLEKTALGNNGEMSARW